VVAQADARKAPLTGAAVDALLAEVDRLYAVRGRAVAGFDLRETRPPRATLRSLVLGPIGNLRAPTLRAGRTLIVGFDEATYAKLLL
jgi:hypothetical protein